MIENIIYWVGVTTLISGGVLATLFCWWLITCALLKLLVKDLKRTYNHVQLFYFMGEIKNRGYAQALEEVSE